MKRFWTGVSLQSGEGSHAILLDGRPMRLPGGPLLSLRSLALAEAVAEEWRCAPALVSTAHLPLTAIAGTVQDRIAPDPIAAARALAAYTATDLLCYRAETPDALIEREAAAWGPWLDWARDTLGARLRVTSGIMPLMQPAEAVAALEAASMALSPDALGALGIIVPATGSLVLGLAFAADALSIAELYDLAMLDEMFQAELWGSDREAEARRGRIRRDLDDAARFLVLSRVTAG